MIYGDPARRVVRTGADLILRQAAAAPSLAMHLQSVASVNPIYAQLREAAVKEALLPGGGNSAKLAANLDRVRSIPGKGRVVIVDAASATLWMSQDGRPVESMKVVVGKLEVPTPMIASTIYYATMNPYWHVPDHLVRKAVAPNVVKQGPSYLKSRGYQVIDRWDDNANIIPPDQVDWKGAAAGTVEIKVRQLPGGTNSMGKMKFNFPNNEGIYLHDTPLKEYFAKSVRTLSNGCIRLEDAARLGRWLMGSDLKAPNASPEQHLPLPQGVPVYVTYLTAQPKVDGMAYINDVYGRDRVGAQVAALR
jgi:murein L,D-transpeptidase YcbB/YkuD